MKTLILINAAPYHRPFFLKVGQELSRRGHQVSFAKDSAYSDYLYDGSELPGASADFAAYFRDHFTSARLPARYESLNLWTAAFPDLDRAEHASTLRRPAGYYQALLTCLVCFFDELYERSEIECVAYENVSNTFAFVAFLVAQARGIRFIGFAMSRLPGRVDVCDGFAFGHSATHEIYRALLEGRLGAPPEIRAATSDYVENIDARTPDYVSMNAGLASAPWTRYFRAGPAKNFAKSVDWYLRDSNREFAHQVGNPFVAYPEFFVRDAVRFGRAVLLKRLLNKPAALDVPFFLYPMQVHPESGVAVDGRYATEELLNIVNIAMNLPAGVMLYVKDHPMAPGRHSMDFYLRVSRIPNVRLIDPTLASKSLIRRAKAVVTLTSTAGIEAIVLGIPTFVLGHPFYEFHPLVRRVSCWDDAFDTFAEYTTMRATLAEREAFVAAYFLSSIVGNYNLKAACDEPDSIAAIASAIERDPAAENLAAATMPTADRRV